MKRLQTIPEGYRRIAAVRRDDRDGYGDRRSLINFLQCEVAAVIQEMQPLAEWFMALPVNVQGANLACPIMSDLIDEWLELHRLAREIGKALGSDFPTSAIAAHPLYGPEGDHYTIRYDWQAGEWFDSRGPKRLSWPTLEAFKRFARRAA